MQTRNELLSQLLEDMHTTKRLMQPCFVSILGRLHISPTQAHMLLVIDEAQPLSLKALAAKMWLTPGAVTQLVDALDQFGYIARMHDTKDRRIVHISLSAAGKQLIGKITRSHNEVMADILATLNDTEVRQLAGIQHKMAENLETLTKTWTAKKEKA
jgi:DNA-binding MarR family transcriptional regulator